ncbi:MAG: protein kinase [Deltaproteobacteria bacterium]|nr:protein kinase [Deltaproteobacteria bacterium]
MAARLGLSPGDVVGGRYEIVSLLGEGGMGAVFQAKHRVLGRIVAIKVLKPDMATSEQFAGRFLQEAKSAAELHHKNIVEISDYGVDGDRPYMVMEYLQGESLDAYMEREGPLSPARVVAIMEPVLRALAMAHERGIIHRDIKPDNIFLQSDADGGEPIPKVVDFGIAKRQSNDDSPQLTTANMALGTPAYMAPEQIMSSKNATGAADQYAVGVTLYEALTGSYPFEATTINQFIVAKATQDARPITELRPDLDPALAATVMRTLARKPEDRFPTIHALREALSAHRAPLSSRPVQPGVEGTARAGNITVGNRSPDPGAPTGVPAAPTVIHGSRPESSSVDTPFPVERPASDGVGSSMRIGVAVVALLALGEGIRPVADALLPAPRAVAPNGDASSPAARSRADSSGAALGGVLDPGRAAGRGDHPRRGEPRLRARGGDAPQRRSPLPAPDHRARLRDHHRGAHRRSRREPRPTPHGPLRARRPTARPPAADADGDADADGCANADADADADADAHPDADRCADAHPDAHAHAEAADERSAAPQHRPIEPLRGAVAPRAARPSGASPGRSAPGAGSATDPTAAPSPGRWSCRGVAATTARAGRRR